MQIPASLIFRINANPELSLQVGRSGTQWCAELFDCAVSLDEPVKTALGTTLQIALNQLAAIA